GAEEEQPVADDRAADPGAPALVGLDRGDLVAGDRAAAQAVVRILEEAAAVERVLARLGDDVDRAPGEVAIFDVEGRELDLRLAHRIVRDRGRTARREAGIVEAVDVALADAVDGEGVAAVVAAEARDAVLARAAVVAVETDARVEADDVADVAVEARCRLELLASEAGTRSDRELGHADAAAGDDDHAAAAGQREPEARAALQVGHDVRNRLALEALGVRGHGVGATGYEAGRGERAIRDGSNRPRRAGARVGDGRRCPRNRVARFVGNGAVDP